MSYKPTRAYVKFDPIFSEALARVAQKRNESDPRRVLVDLARERLINLGELPWDYQKLLAPRGNGKDASNE